MIRRTSSLLWTANYFRHIKPSSQKTLPAPRTNRNGSPPLPEVASQTHQRSSRSRQAPVDISNLSHDAIREQLTTSKAVGRPKPSVKRSGLSPAHNSALALVGQALSKLRNGAHVDHLRFQVMSEVVPSLKLVLPMPIPRAGHLTGMSTNASSSANGKRRLVAVPTSRIPSLEKASDVEVSHFLDSISPPPPREFDANSAASPSSGVLREADPIFTLDEVTLMLQLAVKFDVKDVDLTLRLLGEFERLLLLKRRQREARNQRRAAHEAEGEPLTVSSVSQVPPVNPDFKFTPSSVARFLYLASCVGFLENHNLQLFLRFHITPLMKRHAFSPRQLVHIAVALYRFDLHKDSLFDMTMSQIASACRGTSIRPSADHVSAVSNLPQLHCRISRDSSIAHPTHDLSVDILLELINCVALSIHREDGLIAAITYRIIFLCSGTSVTRRQEERAGNSDERDSHLFEASTENLGPSPPTAEQIHFACTMFRQMEAPNEVLETALMSLASKHGIILNHGGDTREEEGGTYTEFTGDLVKVQ
ncbi:Hypothetical protein, putative [Bodo saltans]|uniref:Uncharacterized protein n=1 Tax=Bodo saltans TaxID=75058 RepID=A0A0S4JC11_BODSA|nr:Hypothetical protein, putative [Bodo saltans]|eukprot:CUG86394.1 Hypothetical protein, putative [Bodo saltans]